MGLEKADARAFRTLLEKARMTVGFVIMDLNAFVVSYEGIGVVGAICCAGPLSISLKLIFFIFEASMAFCIHQQNA